MPSLYCSDSDYCRLFNIESSCRLTNQMVRRLKSNNVYIYVNDLIILRKYVREKNIFRPVRLKK